VLEVVTEGGVLIQCDAAGGHILGPGLSADVALAPAGTEVLDLILANGFLYQLDSTGVHTLGQVF